MPNSIWRVFLLAFVSTVVSSTLRADAPPAENPAAPAERLSVTIDRRRLSERWHRVMIADFQFHPARYLILPPSKALQYLEDVRRLNPMWRDNIRYTIETYRGNGKWVKSYYPMSD
jgi:hypothetical protein